LVATAVCIADSGCRMSSRHKRLGRHLSKSHSRSTAPNPARFTSRTAVRGHPVGKQLPNAGSPTASRFAAGRRAQVSPRHVSCSLVESVVRSGQTCAVTPA
jgi:hypothetical protein